ncbi:MAG: DUF3800 domain-containing protein [Planctomycetaceae bacterium]|nr:DUF3800 domain-containing protein [Planctomycetaceae bacterium]
MLLFIDESGHHESGTPCEVLAGVAVSEDNLWNLVKAVRSAERDHFGDHLRNLVSDETKARGLLKTKRFRIAAKECIIPDGEGPRLAHSLLVKGKRAREQKSATAGETYREMVAYSREVLAFVHDVLDIAAGFSVQVFASVTDPKSPRPEKGNLRKDYVYLFERYFYYLETLPPRERGLVVFDELEKTQAHLLLQQMAAYFLWTQTGRYRSSRIVPEPFFVHSDLTTGVFLADLAAYIIGWAWRLDRMTQPSRLELRLYEKKLHDMQYRGEKPKQEGNGVWQLYGITYIDDLRGHFDRPEEEQI